MLQWLWSLNLNLCSNLAWHQWRMYYYIICTEFFFVVIEGWTDTHYSFKIPEFKLILLMVSNWNYHNVHLAILLNCTFPGQERSGTPGLKSSKSAHWWTWCKLWPCCMSIVHTLWHWNLSLIRIQCRKQWLWERIIYKTLMHLWIKFIDRLWRFVTLE